MFTTLIILNIYMNLYIYTYTHNLIVVENKITFVYFYMDLFSSWRLNTTNNEIERLTDFY